jgi:hypothetical protein
MAPNKRFLTLKEKIEIVQFYNKEKVSVRALARRFEIGKTQAATIVSKRDELLMEWETNVNVNKKRNFFKPEGLKIDELCYNWFLQARNKNIPLSGGLIRTKAKEIANNLKIQSFAASSGWLERFKKRHNITFKTVSGEAGSVSSERTVSRKTPFSSTGLLQST